MFKKLNLLVLSLGIVISNVYAISPIDVTDITFNINSGSEKLFYYKFATGDTIILNSEVTKGNDISEISVQEFPTSIKYQAISIKNINDKKIYVPKTNVFIFQFKNTASFKSKTYQINVKRIPATDSLVAFSTFVEWDTLYDTTYISAVDTILVKLDTTTVEIKKTQVKIGSQLSGDSRSSIQINIPDSTNYFAYWIGVGQEANEGLQAMANKLPEAAVVLGIVNPVVAFALGIIPQLFTLPKGQQVDYYFIADYQNLTNFLAGEAFYYIKKGEEIITDYDKMDVPSISSIYLGFDNSHGRMSDRLVTVNIVAVKIVPKYNYNEINKPIINKNAVPKLD